MSGNSSGSAVETEREKKMLEHQVEALEQRCEAMRQTMVRAIGGLREPLGTVSNYMRFVNARYGDRLDPDGNAFIASAVDAVTRMEQVMSELSNSVEGKKEMTSDPAQTP